MRLVHWLRSLASRTPAGPRRAARRAGHGRPALEALEGRLCPSGGALDTSFGQGGVAALSSTALRQVFATVVQPDGKVVEVGMVYVNGVEQTGVVRLKQDGSLDTTFNNTGTEAIKIGVRSQGGTAVALQPDGKILIGTRPIVWADKWDVTNYDSEYAVVRLNPNGTLDTSFGNARKGNGVFAYNPTSGKEQVGSLAVLDDGSIIAGGTTGAAAGSDESFTALKLTPGGALDTRFGSGGVAVVHLGPSGTNDSVGRMAVVPGTNQVVMVGAAGAPAAVVVLTAGGQLDTTFNGTGYRLDNPTGAESVLYGSVVVQPNPTGGYRIVAAGNMVARYTLSGALDTTFGGVGTGFYFQANNSVVPFGEAGSGYSTTAGPNTFSAISLAKDGSLVVAGEQNYWDANNTYTMLAVGHLSADGVLDPTFGSNAGYAYLTEISRYYGVLAIDPTSGEIVACGQGTSGTRAARFTAP